MPELGAFRNAAAISTPSTKLWTVSPTMISVPLRPWSCARRDGRATSQSSVWQWRHSTSFSSTKNTKMPAEDRERRRCGCPSRTLAESLRGTPRRAARRSHRTPASEPRIARTSAERAARPAESVPPASSRRGSRRASWGPRILRRQPDQRGHAFPALSLRTRKIASVGIGTEIAALDSLHALQALARHRIQIEQPVSRPRRREARR